MRNQRGFSPALIIVLVAVPILLFFGINFIRHQPGSYSQQPQQPQNQKVETKDTAGLPVLYNIGINIDKYDPRTNKAGDFIFQDTNEDYQHKIFLEFMVELGGPGGKKSSLPSFNYVLPLDTVLFSPVHGTVDLVHFQKDRNDYEIGIIPDGASDWRLYFDHVVNIKVAKGDKLKPNDPIGTATPWEAIPGKGFVELQVEKAERDRPRASCPVLLLDASVRASIEAKIIQFAKDWEEFLGRDVYDESKWVAPGCLAKIDES